MCFLLSQLDEVLDKLSQGPSTSCLLIVDTMDTSGEDTDTSQPRRRVRSKRIFKMKKSYATDELTRFFVTGPRYAKKTYLYSPMAAKRSYGNSNWSGTSRGINASGLRLLDGAFLVSTAILWLKMSWRGNVTKFCGLPYLFGTESTRS